MSRKQALENGEKTYEGKPCKNCSTTTKFTSNWGCVRCSMQRQENPEVRKRYEQSSKGKAVRKKINQSDAHKKRIQSYNNGPKGKAAQDNFYKNNPEKYLEYRCSKYGISVDQYNQMLTEQQHSCKVCGANDPGARSLHIDHNHDTGEVRGLLCHGCNTALGLLKEDINIMKGMIDYVSGRT